MPRRGTPVTACGLSVASSLVVDMAAASAGNAMLDLGLVFEQGRQALSHGLGHRLGHWW